MLSKSQVIYLYGTFMWLKEENCFELMTSHHTLNISLTICTPHNSLLKIIYHKAEAGCVEKVRQGKELYAYIGLALLLTS